MKAKPARVVFAIYSANGEEPERAFRALRAIERRGLSLLREDGSVQGAPVEARYAVLRLEGESAIIARTQGAGVQAIVKQLRLTGSPAVFVLREDLERLPASDGTSWRPEASKSSILTRLKENQIILDASRSDLLEAARLDHALTAAAEWILDNVYLIRTQIAEVRRHLPRDYPKILPTHDPEFGHPRVYEIAHQLVTKTEFAVDEANIVAHLAESQKGKPLSVAELWFFPLLLRVALIEGVTQLVVQVSRAQELREAAYLWAKRLAAAARRDPAAFERTLLLMEDAPYALQPYFVSSLVEQLQDEDRALAPVQRWVENRLNTRLTDLVRNEHSRESTERLSTANAFGSLRALSRIDFTKIFEATSAVEAELRRDPGEIYARSDFATRDRCRQVVERIARHSEWAEHEVARRAVALAAAASDPRFGHVAYYLLDEGVTQLEGDLRVSVPFRTRIIRSVRRNATPLYLGGIIGLTACLLALSLAFAWDAGVRHQLLLAALGMLALFPLSELSTQIVNALVISLLPPDALPKMDFRNGVPPEDASLIVVPMMLTSAESIRREIEKLEVRFFANPDSHIYFSLFPDFTDSPEPAAPNDAELVETIRKGIEDLNARHPGGRFLLFHRQRAWSEGEQLWIGRERKRGKIEELNAYLAGEGPEEILLAGCASNLWVPSQPADRSSQNSSQRPLSWQQRKVMMAFAPWTVQRIPDCFSRSPMVLQPASTTPEPTKRPWRRKSA